MRDAAYSHIVYPKKDELTIEHINAQSLLSSLDEVKLLVIERNIDVLCVSESWLTSHTPDMFINFPNYKVFRNDNGRGAGTCIYAKSVLNPILINIDVPKQEGVEDVWIKVQRKKFPSIIVGCMYRHPKALAASFDYIQDVFKQVCLQNKKVFILGDFNDDLLSKGNKVGKIIKNSSLTQVIDTPTRITSSTSTLLDLIITNTPQCIASNNVVPQVIADHDLISVTVKVSKPKRLPVTKTFRQLTYYTNDIFSSLLLDNVYRLNDIFLTDDVDKQVFIFNEVFIHCLDMCAPMVTKVVKRPPTPWMNDELRNAIKDRNETQSRLKDDRQNSFLQQVYKTKKNLVKTMISETKSNYYKKEIINCKGKTSSIWQVVKEIIPCQKMSLTLMTLIM